MPLLFRMSTMCCAVSRYCVKTIALAKRLSLAAVLLLIALPSVGITGDDDDDRYHGIFSFRISIRHLSFGCSIFNVLRSVLISFTLGSFSNDLLALLLTILVLVL